MYPSNLSGYEIADHSCTSPASHLQIGDHESLSIQSRHAQHMLAIMMSSLRVSMLHCVKNSNRIHNFIHPASMRKQEDLHAPFKDDPVSRDVRN